MEDDDDDWEETATDRVWVNTRTGRYVFSDECSQFSALKFATEEDAILSLSRYVSTL